MKNSETDDHFRLFATRLQRNNTRKYGAIPESRLLEVQKGQIERLVALETAFKRELVSGPYGQSVYRKFIDFICDERKNILDARPYFRERQLIFTKSISTALKLRSERRLYRFHFNWQFIAFVLRARRWAQKSKLLKIAEEIRTVRTEIVEMNLPLAISRARIFYSRTPKSHLAHMDFVQISCEGLLSGVDKFCLPFSRAFRSVCIGRMVGNFIERYSETLVHFYPVDKRKIYRANKAASRIADCWADLDFEALAEAVNHEVDDPTHRTTGSEIASLMSASSVISADDSEPLGDTNSVTRVDGKLREVGISRYAAPESDRPDVQFEQAETVQSLGKAISGLLLIERKVLRLKGVEAASL